MTIDMTKIELNAVFVMSDGNQMTRQRVCFFYNKPFIYKIDFIESDTAYAIDRSGKIVAMGDKNNDNFVNNAVYFNEENPAPFQIEMIKEPSFFWSQARPGMAFYYYPYKQDRVLVYYLTRDFGSYYDVWVTEDEENAFLVNDDMLVRCSKYDQGDINDYC